MGMKWRMGNKSLGSGLWPIYEDRGQGDSGIPICYVDYGRVECVDNARLIEAAPIMIEAIELALEIFRIYIPATDEGVAMEKLMEARDAARGRKATTL